MFNLDQVTEAANRRRAALEHLSEQLKEIPDMLAAMNKLHAQGARLRTAINALDDEAKKLVGEPNVRALNVMWGSCVTPQDALCRVDERSPYSPSGEYSNQKYVTLLNKMAAAARGDA